MARLVHVIAVLCLGACASRTSPIAEPAPRPATESATIATAPVTRGARVDVDLVGPSRVRYSPATLGAPGPQVRITVHNDTAVPLDVSALRVRLDVTRKRAPVACGAEATGTRGEPSTLAAGDSASFVRSVDCALPLAGAYAVDVVVAFGRSGPWAEGRVARRISLVVGAPKDAEPRPIEAVPGLWAAVGAANIVRPSEKSGRLVVAVVNASPAPLEVPPVRVALRVRRVGVPIACEDAPISLPLAGVLAPGARHTIPVPVSCLGLGVTGTYDVEARLLVPKGDAAGDSEHPIGTLRIEVARDPARVTPMRP